LDRGTLDLLVIYKKHAGQVKQLDQACPKSDRSVAYFRNLYPRRLPNSFALFLWFPFSYTRYDETLQSEEQFALTVAHTRRVDCQLATALEIVLIAKLRGISARRKMPERMKTPR